MKSIINTTAQFIPIITIFILLTQYNDCVSFSHTILGKVVALSIVLFYTRIDKILGLFVSSLLILFYQTDCSDNMLNIESFDNIENEEDKEEIDPEFAETKSAKSCGSCTVKDIETFENVNADDEVYIQAKHGDTEFRKEHCVNGQLKHKDMNVKNEMAHHIYPELKFKNDYCNACSPTCQYSIIETKINTENKLLPILSK